MVLMLVDFSMALADITVLKEVCEMWLLFQFSTLCVHYCVISLFIFFWWGRGADKFPKHFTSYHLPFMYLRTLYVLFFNVF